MRRIGSYRIGVKIGEQATPCFVAVSDDKLYVTEEENHRVSVFTQDGDFVCVFGSLGSGEGQFNQPRGVAVVGERVLVADAGNDRVSVHELDGTFVQAYGSRGAGNGQFDGLYGLGAVEGGSVYAADGNNKRVQVMKIAAGSGDK